MKKLVTVVILSAISYSFSSSAKDNCDPCYGQDQESCEAPGYCLWNEEEGTCGYNYSADEGEGTEPNTDADANRDGNKMGIKYLGGGNCGAPWGGPWGGPNWGQPSWAPPPPPWSLPWPVNPWPPRPWGGPWGGYGHTHGRGCGH